MKLTPEMIAQMEAPIAEYEQSDLDEDRCIALAFRLLIADLEEVSRLSAATVKAYSEWQRSLHLTSENHCRRVELHQAFVVAISKQAAPDTTGV